MRIQQRHAMLHLACFLALMSAIACSPVDTASTVRSPNILGYPRHAIHTREWTYIRNYEPDRWPAGDPDIKVSSWDFFGDSDPTPAKQFMLDNRDDAYVREFFELSLGKVPEHELYNKTADPDMIHNLAYDPKHADRAAQMQDRMEQYLIETGDPRMRGETPWDLIDLDR
jgi:N-sulfoglucosamine sulfohydrolase